MTAATKKFWQRLSPTQLMVLMNVFSVMAIFFEGYDQGVMGGVNGSPHYQTTVGIGSNGEVTNTTKQGGIVSVYYLGVIFGCFIGGYIADKLGRIRGVFVGSLWSILGGALQAGAQNSNMMICARVISGIGCGHLTAIVPVWSAEVATAHDRGSLISLVFLANYIGIATAYWLSFGLSYTDTEAGTSQVRWRFPLAFQIIPALMLAAFINLLPESPRYLVEAGRDDEAQEVFFALRGTGDEVQAELDEVKSAVKDEKETQPSFLQIVSGRNSEATSGAHLGRRAFLAFFLQIMCQWDGIGAVTVYSPTLYSKAGYGSTKSAWLSALGNTIGIVGTFVAAQLVDRVGRRKLLMGGAVIQGFMMFIQGGLDQALVSNPAKASQLGAASASMLFIYTFVFSCSWLMVPFIYPTELWPASLRAKGNAFGVSGWAVGCGMATLLNPVMLSSISEKTFYLFGALNFAWVPIIYCIYPETSRRTLESIDALFSTKSWWTWDEEREYRSRIDQVAARIGLAKQRPEVQHLEESCETGADSQAEKMSSGLST